MKEKQFKSNMPTQKYNDTQQKTYRYNEKIYVSGTHDSSAVNLSDTHNHNIYIHSHNTNIRSDSGTGTLVDIDSSAKHNKVTVEVSGGLTTNARNMTSLDTCISLVCNRGNNNSDIKIRVDNANINTNVK